MNEHAEATLLTKRPAKGGDSKGQGGVGRRRGDRRRHVEGRVPPRASPSLLHVGLRLILQCAAGSRR